MSLYETIPLVWCSSCPQVVIFQGKASRYGAVSTWVAAMLADAFNRLEHIFDRAEEGHVTVRSRGKSRMTHSCQLTTALDPAGSCRCVVVHCGLCHACPPRSRHKTRQNRHRSSEKPHSRERTIGVVILGTAASDNISQRLVAGIR